ncbi:hypothetical protein AB182_19245 [Phytobacter ursingii]|uniref:Uncharacterized protein n=1 Tax=Phytobacter ursingii TaxID=1972431 RepID=A0AAC8TNC7_9ENTR|nr:hypothetical protein AB182_19245 [Phytobacter ursingii]
MQVNHPSLNHNYVTVLVLFWLQIPLAERTVVSFTFRTHRLISLSNLLNRAVAPRFIVVKLFAAKPDAVVNEWDESVEELFSL